MANSKAYEEGYNSCLNSPYRNPYPEDSFEFNEYERGRTQKIKRSSGYLADYDYFPDDEIVERKLKASVDKPNRYAQAKYK
ncbi:hypothetical protein K6Y31_21675 [Motilimonas cestriensis]|uniref:Uncharacterized protein n=1 Tax=Motilimonas cestriensis TaxID=2742685 RepID=A0ABS8WEB8_9GAMM|nr:hypothetical protein [Motilimonas cestriensis]MCE2597384.1 hypothetical protein [Motilimonas cestriensis]